MLQDGEKGVVILRNKHNYALTPHLRCGLTDPDTLLRIAEVARKYRAEGLKITPDAQIALLGIELEDVDAVWEELALEPSAQTGCTVRPVRACCGTGFCKEAMTETLDIAAKIDEKYHGREMPARFEIAVSGCINDCAEGALRDLALVGMLRGWKIFIGGTSGSTPRLARLLAENLSTDQALIAVDKIIDWYRGHAKNFQRIGVLVEQGGIEPLKALLRE